VTEDVDEIGNDYIRTQRPDTGEEMMDFANEPSSSAAILKAALCETKVGKRHAHQRRIPRGLADVPAEIEWLNNITNAKTLLLQMRCRLNILISQGERIQNG
jgi:hypothetical protein